MIFFNQMMFLFNPDIEASSACVFWTSLPYLTLPLPIKHKKTWSCRHSSYKLTWAWINDEHQFNKLEEGGHRRASGQVNGTASRSTGGQRAWHLQGSSWESCLAGHLRWGRLHQRTIGQRTSKTSHSQAALPSCGLCPSIIVAGSTTTRQLFSAITRQISPNLAHKCLPICEVFGWGHFLKS